MEPSARTFDVPRWYWIFAVWFGIALFDATQTVFVMRAEGMHHYWARLYITQLLSWTPLILATPYILWFGHKFPMSQWNRATNWAVHLGACATLCAISALWAAMLEEWLNPWALSHGPDPFLQLSVRKFFSGLLSSVVLYGLVLLVGHIRASEQRLSMQQAETARLNEQLTKAQLNALRRQIEPHFLFNTLNAIAGLVRENRSEAAVSMIARLSDFLRRTVNDSDRQQVALGEELEFTQKYLEIQKARFADRLAFSMNVPEDLMSARIPSMILQPIVENGVKHGIAKRLHGGLIRIDAARVNSTLKVKIYNDGPSLPEGWEQTTEGVGVKNVRTRLQGLYGDAFELSLRNRRSGVEVSVSVPYVKIEPNTAHEPACSVAV